MMNAVEPKSIEELEAMHTGSLMSRRKALLQCKESASLSGQDAREVSGLIEFKDTSEWQRAYSDLKQILSQRENVPNKQERKALRQAAARFKR